jgi:hypothetical protein
VLMGVGGDVLCRWCLPWCWNRRVRHNTARTASFPPPKSHYLLLPITAKKGKKPFTSGTLDQPAIILSYHSFSAETSIVRFPWWPEYGPLISLLRGRGAAHSIQSGHNFENDSLCSPRSQKAGGHVDREIFDDVPPYP